MTIKFTPDRSNAQRNNYSATYKPYKIVVFFFTFDITLKLIARSFHTDLT